MFEKERKAMLAIEIDMVSWYNESGDDVYYEDASRTVEGLIAKVTGTFKKVLNNMRAFASNMSIYIEKLVQKTRIHSQLRTVQAKLRKGETVYLPDASKINAEYNKAMKEVKREINNLSRALNGIHLKSGDVVVDDYFTKKDEVADKIIKLVDGFEEISSNPPKIELGPNSSEATVMRQFSKARVILDNYVELTKEINQLAILYERVTKNAEIDYRTKMICVGGLNIVQRAQIASTKLVRKSVFCIASVIG